MASSVLQMAAILAGSAGWLYHPLSKAPESSTGSLLNGRHCLDALQECLLTCQPHNTVCPRVGGEWIANMTALVAIMVGGVFRIPPPNYNFLNGEKIYVDIKLNIAYPYVSMWKKSIC